MLLRKMMMAKTSAPTLAVSGTFATPVDNGDPLTGSLTITGGVSPYSVSVYSGTAPPGVTFSVSGSSVVASGNTTTDGTYSWTLRVTSTDGQHADSAQSVTVESAPSWEDVVSGLSPLVWLKMNEANETDFEANGNHGSDGGTLACVGTVVTFGEPAIMPSEPTRTTTDPGTGNGACRLIGLATTLNSTAAIYFIYKGTTGASGTQIAWRDCNSAGTGGNWFLQFNNTNVNFQIRGANATTTYASSNIKDGNPHLIGLAISASDASLWVDGVEVWTGSLGGSTATRSGWQYMSNSGAFSSQKLYGDFGDFVVFGSTLTDTEHADLYAAFSGT